MSCPHGKASSPESCSQCVGARARVVTNAGPELLVDGEPTGRAVDRTAEVRSYYARRGGNARGRGRPRKATP